MNERIRELAEQAGINKDAFQFSGTPIKHIVDEPSLEKFAELIVKECIHALWTEECRTNAMTQAEYERSGHRIHKHFWG